MVVVGIALVVMVNGRDTNEPDAAPAKSIRDESNRDDDLLRPSPEPPPRSDLVRTLRPPDGLADTEPTDVPAAAEPAQPEPAAELHARSTDDRDAIMRADLVGTWSEAAPPYLNSHPGGSYDTPGTTIDYLAHSLYPDGRLKITNVDCSVGATGTWRYNPAARVGPLLVLEITGGEQPGMTLGSVDMVTAIPDPDSGSGGAGGELLTERGMRWLYLDQDPDLECGSRP